MKHIDRDVILLVLSCVIIGWAIFHFGWLRVLLTIIIFIHRVALPYARFFYGGSLYICRPTLTPRNGVDREIN